MLIAARDLVAPQAGLTRADIREEMSGNLCRCTGYVGIVSAIETVMAERDGLVAKSEDAGGWLGPAPGPQKTDRLTPSTSARKLAQPIAAQYGLIAPESSHRRCANPRRGRRHRAAGRRHRRHSELHTAPPAKRGLVADARSRGRRPLHARRVP